MHTLYFYIEEDCLIIYILFLFLNWLDFINAMEELAEANLHVRVLIKYDDYWWIHCVYYDPELLFFMQDIDSLSEECFIEILQQKYIYSAKNFDFAMCFIKEKIPRKGANI